MSRPNMSYVKFENTFAALQQCYEDWSDDNISTSEQNARKKLVELMKLILEEEEGYTVSV